MIIHYMIGGTFTLASSSAFLISTTTPHHHDLCVSQFRRRSSSSIDGCVIPPSKGDLYNDDELFDLLKLHQRLNEGGENKDTDTSRPNNDDTIIYDSNVNIVGGVHDWVLQALSEEEGEEFTKNGIDPLSNDVTRLFDKGSSNGYPMEDISAIPNVHKLVLETIGGDPTNQNNAGPEPGIVNQLAYNNLQAILQDKKPFIRAIATDVDGTLLSVQYMHPITEEAVVRAIQEAYYNCSSGINKKKNKIQHFFPATGKSRQGAISSLGPIVGPLLLKCPGVYIQGLYCVDKEGNVIFEKRLSNAAIRAAEELVTKFNISIVGYDGDELYTTEQTDVVRDLSEVYGEPTVMVLMNKKECHSSAISLAEHPRGLHKLLLMDNDAKKLASIRVTLEELAMKHDATVTQAIPTMLELLPGGCSKADGVQRVCDALGIDPAEELLALGDAENDTGMLQMACIGVAVGNASPLARDAADIIMRERNDEGGAGLAMNMFAFDN